MTDLDAIARRFVAAQRANERYEAPSAVTALSLDEAYAVQRTFNGLRADEKVAGYKSAANAEARQQRDRMRAEAEAAERSAEQAANALSERDRLAESVEDLTAQVARIESLRSDIAARVAGSDSKAAADVCAALQGHAVRRRY